jgi:hypothetical protein
MNLSIENLHTPRSRRERHSPRMADIGKVAEWLLRYDGLISVDVEGESPARLRVEFATEERAADFISTSALLDGIKVLVVGKCTVVIEDD